MLLSKVDIVVNKAIDVMINIQIFALEYFTNRFFLIEIIASITTIKISIAISMSQPPPLISNGAKMVVAAIGIDVLSPITIDNPFKIVLFLCL